MSRKDSKSIQTIKDILDADKHKLIAFIAINDDGCQHVCYGAENRSELIMLVGELQALIHDIFEIVNMEQDKISLKDILRAVDDEINEGDYDVKVLN